MDSTVFSGFFYIKMPYFPGQSILSSSQERQKVSPYVLWLRGKLDTVRKLMLTLIDSVDVFPVEYEAWFSGALLFAHVFPTGKRDERSVDRCA